MRDLNLNGRNLHDALGPLIYADHAVLRDNEITNRHTGICVHVTRTTGSAPPRGVVITGNRIHDCGRLPATNQDHGIYVAEARNTVIRGNWIYDNADRGVQLYPDADGTVVTGNVIDGNGEGVIFGGSPQSSSDDNLVEHNAITNSTVRYNVEASWGGAAGHGNVARNNCSFGGAQGAEQRRHSGAGDRLLGRQQRGRRSRLRGPGLGRLPARLGVALRRDPRPRPALGPAPLSEPLGPPSRVLLDACTRPDGRRLARSRDPPIRRSDGGWSGKRTFDGSDSGAGARRRSPSCGARRGVQHRHRTPGRPPPPPVPATGTPRPAAADAAAGTEAAPVRSAERLLATLAPGQTGCLRSGIYAWAATSRSGRQASP